MGDIDWYLRHGRWTPAQKKEVGIWFKIFAKGNRGFVKEVVPDAARRRTVFRVVRGYLFEGESQDALSARHGVGDVGSMVRRVLIKSKIVSEGRLKKIDTTTKFPGPDDPNLPGRSGPGIGKGGRKLTGPPDLSDFSPETIDWLTGRRGREDFDRDK